MIKPCNNQLKCPLFSIIIPAFNAEKYIKECFESIKNQSFENYEIIIIDDGSTDETPDICDLFVQSSKNKATVIHQNNLGLLLTRNVGISIAKGKYILFIDADDVLLPGALQYCFDMTEIYNPDILVFRARRTKEGKSESVIGPPKGIYI